ncbi:MAG: septal ring lytic transglycosylase RlpA family protein [Methylococcales bacterium]|nr:septal ring lytic transglycosylase RlpA family protein [Methylococcales bacterium]
MNRFLLIILIITLNACSTEPVMTSGATFDPQLVDEPATYTSPKLVLKYHSKVPLTRKGTGYAQQEDLFPRIAKYIKKGVASWYGPGFHGRKTATGEIFDMYAMTAAHKTLPIPSYAQVTNLENNRSIIVRINDRGPFVRNRELDLSYAAAKNLDMMQDGTGKIEIKTIPESQALPQLQQLAEEQEQDLYLQVGSFGSQKKALQLKDKITAFQLPEPDIRSSTYKRSTLYKVQIGPIDSESSAKELSEQLAKIGIRDTQFVTESKQSTGSRVIM